MHDRENSSFWMRFLERNEQREFDCRGKGVCDCNLFVLFSFWMRDSITSKAAEVGYNTALVIIFKQNPGASAHHLSNRNKP